MLTTIANVVRHLEATRRVVTLKTKDRTTIWLEKRTELSTICCVSYIWVELLLNSSCQPCVVPIEPFIIIHDYNIAQIDNLCWGILNV
jgi:hypothetical protein